MIKESIHQDDITILNMYASKNKASIYVEQTDKTERRNRQIHNYICEIEDLL